MSRNRGKIECECGYVLGLKDSFTRALHFKEYLNLIGIARPEGFHYYREFAGLIGCGVMCPECYIKYYFWIGGIQYLRELNRNYQIHFGDTSIWEDFGGG